MARTLRQELGSPGNHNPPRRYVCAPSPAGPARAHPCEGSSKLDIETFEEKSDKFVDQSKVIWLTWTTRKAYSASWNSISCRALHHRLFLILEETLCHIRKPLPGSIFQRS